MVDIKTLQDEPDKSLPKLIMLLSLLGLSAYTLGQINSHLKDELSLWFN